MRSRFVHRVLQNQKICKNTLHPGVSRCHGTAVLFMVGSLWVPKARMSRLTGEANNWAVTRLGNFLFFDHRSRGYSISLQGQVQP